MGEIIKEIFTAFKEKISSPFFRYFSISWLLWNYKFVYFITFVDEAIYEKVHHITKYDYLINHTYFYGSWYCNIAIFLIAPLISTWFMIFVFPEINVKFLRKYIQTLNDEYDEKQQRRKKIKLWDLEIAKITLEETQTETSIIEEQVKQKEVVKEKEVNQFDEWKKEYGEFKSTTAYKDFSNIIEIVNFYNWYFTSVNTPYKIRVNTISYLLANNIIVKSEKENRHHLFTEKWKYFSKLYFEENNK